MATPTSIREIDLAPISGKSYFEAFREWREEFIYFLLVDRFHDGESRAPVRQAARAPGIATPDDFYGGKIKGITRNLDYIAGLGCTAIWLSPVFGNNPGAYHGYNINNYLDVDPHFGTKQDLIDLVEAAHRRDPPMRVVLDVVINHSGDDWAYPGDFPYGYFEDRQFPLGFWRQDDRPIPVELRNDSLYHRRGAISSPGGYDTYPENQHGDIATLKDYANDDDARLLYGQEVLVAYNVSGDRRQDCIVVDASLHRKGDAMTYLYGDLGSRTLDQADDGTLYVRLPLEPHQFVILA